MRSKWLSWTPQEQIFEKTSKTGPAKPPKPGFAGFAGSLQGISPKIKSSPVLRTVLPRLWGRDENGYRIQPTTEQIIEGVRLRGGELWLDGNDELCTRLPKKNRLQLEKLLKDRRAGVYQYLLERCPKIEIPVACRCDQKPYPHLNHDRPRGDERPEIRIKGDLKQLREALIRCQSQSGVWDMSDLVDYMEESALEGEL